MKSSRRHLKKAVSLFFLLFALSFLITGFHHHDDAAAHSDCPICMAAVVYAFQDVPADDGIIFFPDGSYRLLVEILLPNILLLYPAIAYRAPPSAHLA
jgi:hypothetical protein